MNMPIQGTEADLMKLAMVAVEKAFEARTVQGQTSQKVQPGRSDLAQFASKPQQLLQIHDSILVECAEQDAEKVADILKTTMEAIYPDLPVKLAVDTSIGDNWGEL